jgi:hypothetical protein
MAVQRNTKLQLSDVYLIVHVIKIVFKIFIFECSPLIPLLYLRWNLWFKSSFVSTFNYTPMAMIDYSVDRNHLPWYLFIIQKEPKDTKWQVWAVGRLWYNSDSFFFCRELKKKITQAGMHYCDEGEWSIAVSVIISIWNVVALYAGTGWLNGYKGLSSPPFQHFLLFLLVEGGSENLRFSIFSFVLW